MARQPVKITYAHKRGRAKAAPKFMSSPLEDLSPDRDDITRSEMSRRMLKRSRGVAHQDEDRARPKGRAVKRVRQTVEPDALEVEADMSTFQTPFPSAEYVHPLSVTRPLVQEELSPVPSAKRIFSRTSSRNLKENSTSLPLASPFHSRPSSPHPGSISKVKARPSRVPLHLKSRTLSGAFQKNDNAYTRRKLSHKDSTASLNDKKLSRKGSTMSLNDTRLIRKNSTLSLNKIARNSPSSHQRRPLSPDPSYMLSHIAQQDWISPSKALTIHASIDTGSIIRSNSIQIALAIGQAWRHRNPLQSSHSLPLPHTWLLMRTLKWYITPSTARSASQAIASSLHLARSRLGLTKSLSHPTLVMITMIVPAVHLCLFLLTYVLTRSQWVNTWFLWCLLLSLFRTWLSPNRGARSRWVGMI
ncbi:uncharacterized protein EDB91DRAFT_440849 [Suillus paluster]|uniref:uncharacterized protein n=1 Tax=Suillus paluster TaxID=48578 RepID=UPI001B87D549|nr:uncharacterized protein EDB91DRAFT_440849 [Suillus paluster]KAG1738900.1 hypothetical protein EDB91DRAFT_440849 [Suillus paluster]